MIICSEILSWEDLVMDYLRVGLSGGFCPAVFHTSGCVWDVKRQHDFHNRLGEYRDEHKLLLLFYLERNDIG